MNVLFVTQNLREANSIGRELLELLPDLHLDILSNINEANGQLVIPGRIDALLLDSPPHGGDPPALIKTIRAENLPIAVIGLVESADLVSGDKVTGVEIDEYVLRRPGFVASLPGILRRACSRYNPSTAGGSARRVLYAGQAAAPHGSELNHIHLRRDTACAVSFLLRNVEVTESNQGSAHPDDRPEERTAGHEAETNSPERKMGVRLRDLEVQRDAFLRALKSCNEGRIRLKQELSAAWSRWDAERRDLEHRAKHVEDQPRLLETSRAGDEQSLDAEDLRALKARLADRTGQLQAEREQWALRRMSLNRLLEEVEQSRATLEREVLLEEGRREKMIEEHRSERARWESVRIELELRKTSLEEELRLARQGRHGLAEEQEACQKQLDRARVELEGLRPDVESMQSLARKASDQHQPILNRLRGVSGSAGQPQQSVPDLDPSGHNRAGD